MYDSDVSYDYGSDEDTQAGYISEVETYPPDQQSAAQAYTVISPAELAQSQRKGRSGCITLRVLRHAQQNARWQPQGDADCLHKHLSKCCTRCRESRAGSAEVTCGTCFGDLPAAEATSMDCGHPFCNDCWRQHFNVQIREGKSRRLRCMAVGCGMHCDEEKVAELLVDDPELLSKYGDSLLASYVEDNARVRWCPSVPHCGSALRAEGDLHCEPACSCGHKFCFACCDEPHSPCTCQMWRQWKEKCQDDSETKHWLTANTKPCPKCAKPVEKNGGCNLVLCHCGQSFCWLCGGATGRSHTWTEIHGHSCGRYKEDVDKRTSEAARVVQRYQHYFSRWEAHAKGAQLGAEQQHEKVHEKIAALEQNESTLKDYTWLVQAMEQINEARRILGYSYAFAFYMFGNSMFRDEISQEQNSINQGLFEDQQQQIESLVEHLSGLIDMPPESMEDSEDAVRLEVINHAVNLDKRLQKLYELIENDLLGSLMYSQNDIAPYKGLSSARRSPHQSGSLPAPLQTPADAAANDSRAPGGAGKRPRLAEVGRGAAS